MNQIEQLRSQVGKAEEVLAASADRPDGGFAYELQRVSLEAHIADLRAQLKAELDARDHEFLTLRLRGDLADLGTLPLPLLGKLSETVSGVILRTAQYLKTSRSGKNRLPKDITRALDLRLAAVAPGSTQLVISGKTAANLFGDSLMEDVLDRVYGVFHAESAEATMEAVAEIGAAAGGKLHKLCDHLINSGLSMDTIWVSPGGTPRRWEGSSGRLHELRSMLGHLVEREPEEVEFRGRVTLLAEKGRIEVEVDPLAFDERSQTWKLSYIDGLFDQVGALRLRQHVAGLAEKTIVRNETTGIERPRYRLVEIHPVVDT